jgi:hypothetical protein
MYLSTVRVNAKMPPIVANVLVRKYTMLFEVTVMFTAMADKS